MKIKLLLTIIIFSLLISQVTATTLKGTIYNEQLQPEKDVLLQINSTVEQKYLSKDGTYTFELPQGKYQLIAKKSSLATTEEVTISQEGTFIYDIFLLPSFTEEDEIWNLSSDNLITEEDILPQSHLWQYSIAGIIFIIAIIRIIHARKKYGPLKLFRKKIKQESQKTVEQHKEELAKEPGYLEKTLEIIKKHDGRIHQKELRKEMLYLSEAKISLIISELEHKRKIEKIKKGRGNILILKNE
jgi:uncharacterized membrane protein